MEIGSIAHAPGMLDGVSQSITYDLTQNSDEFTSFP